MRRGRRLALALLPTVALAGLAAPGRALVPAERTLLDRMRAAGLERVAEIPGSVSAVHGLLPGEGELRVLLFAGCGPGGERSRHVALVAAADLARTPRRHWLEVVACPAGGAGAGAPASAARRWLDLHPAAAERDGVLAALHLELDDRGGTGGVGLLLAGEGPAGRRLPPAWLAHAALAGARAGGGSLAIGDRWWPLLGQLLGRHARARSATGAEPFLAAGVPALTIAGGGHDAGWSAVVASTVRRLDGLAGRPRDDDAYLVLGGRVWSRRDLYWVGLAVWAVLIAGGRPGAWRGATRGLRRRRGRLFLPAFSLRMLFLGSLLLAPATTLLLLAPASLLSLLPLHGRGPVRSVRLAAGAPAALFAGYWAVALAAGRVLPWPAQPLRLALVLTGILLAVRLIGGPRRAAEVTVGRPAPGEPA